MTIKFRQNTRLAAPNSSGRCSVIIRVSFQSKRTDLYTGILVLPSQWSDRKSRVKQGTKVDGYSYNNLNDTISEQEKFIDDYFNDCATRSALPTLEELRARFAHAFKSSSAGKQSDEFFFLFDKFREDQAHARFWNQDMIDVMARVEAKIREFKPNISFSDLSISTMNAFTIFLSKTMYNDSLIKYLSYLKQFITWASKKNYKINEEYFSYNPKFPTAKKAVRYLTIEELDTISNLDLSNDDMLEKTRDFFVFQCYTALRYSDIKQLRHENIILKENGNYYLDLLTEKDDDRISFKLAKKAVEIYQKYKDFVYEDNLVFPVLSNQKYNNHLKDLGKVAGLRGEWMDFEYKLQEKIVVKTPKDQLSTHTARRTFVVTAMNEGMDLNMIAMITSHSDLKAMKPYIKANTKGTDMVIDAMDRATTK